MRDTKELFVGGLVSFGGGAGGESLEEPVANLKTLSEAKREDEEGDCLRPELAELVVVVAIVSGSRMKPTEESSRIGVERRELGLDTA